MSRALGLAESAASRGEVPVGAVITKEQEIVAEGHNLTVTSNDPTAHAEVVVIREAAQKLGDWRLTECTLYVTWCIGFISTQAARLRGFGPQGGNGGKSGQPGSRRTAESLDRGDRWNAC